MDEEGKNSLGFDKGFLADQMAGIEETVPEVYGPKFNLYFTDRDVRIAFGTIYSVYGEDGEHSHFDRRYKFAVWLPFKSARELHAQLGMAIAAYERDETAEKAEKPESD